VEMNMRESLKEGLLGKLQERYERRSREGKSRMLDDLCEDHGYERKYAIKLLGKTRANGIGRPRPGPMPQYTLIEPVVRTIWLAAEQPCGKRLASALRRWMPHYERHHGKLTQRQRELLKAIKSSHVGSLACGGADRVPAPWEMRDKAWEPAQDSHPDSSWGMGCDAARISRSRHRRALWKEPGRGLHLERDLYGYSQRLDRRPSRVE